MARQPQSEHPWLRWRRSRCPSRRSRGIPGGSGPISGPPEALQEEDEEDAARRTGGAAAPGGAGRCRRRWRFRHSCGDSSRRPQELLEPPCASGGDTRTGVALVPSAGERLPSQGLALAGSSALGSRAPSLAWRLDAPFCLQLGMARPCLLLLPDPVDLLLLAPSCWDGLWLQHRESPEGLMGKSSTCYSLRLQFPLFLGYSEHPGSAGGRIQCTPGGQILLL
uniref:uncharacterized protein n=1 Tax=Lonchura striata TaxID=40157 RepID=UPI000B4D5938|nr:uncharacterized protein LOC110480514 [Lonchura striata domestica]